MFTSIVKSSPPETYKKALAVGSPISGKIVPMQQLPNALFTHGMYGDGIAIEPSGYQLYAPYTGVITSLPHTGHCITLTASNGLRFYMQLGMNSHTMLGEGFKQIAKIGQTYQAGEVLLEFNLVKMRQSLDSTLCPFMLQNSQKLSAIQGHYHQVIATQDVAMTLFI
ncbi:MAG: PTS glucose transporter subunit IIA [Paraglaciecola polaris]|uniref:PTS sugar transporter subunit IIA n=1 Tax=Paraglaciecola polaris TaxID=222814 RepID=UPI0030014009